MTTVIEKIKKTIDPLRQEIINLKGYLMGYSILKNKKINDLCEKVKSYIPFLLYVVIIIICITTPFKIQFNADLGYYLSISQFIAQGMIPFRDFQLAYTPVSFYILAIPYKLFGTNFTGQEALLLLQLFTISNSLILVKILTHFSISKKMAFYWASIYIALNYIADGQFYVLEPIATTFGLCAFYCVLKKTYPYIILAGIFAALAFLTKAYALAFFPIIVLLYILISYTHDKMFFKKCSLLVISYCVTIIFILLFYYVNTGSFHFLSQMSGSGYGSRNIHLILKGCLVVLRNIVIFSITILICYKMLDTMSKKIVLTCFLGFSLFSLQFYFNIFPHYFMFLYPFIIIPAALAIQYIQKTNKIVLMIILIIGSFPIYSNAFAMYKETMRSSIRSEQYQTMKDVFSIIDTQKKVCTYGYHYLHSELQLKPVDYHNNRFGFETFEESRKLIRDADYVLLSKNTLQELKESDTIAYAILKQYQKIEKGKMIILINVK